TRERLVETIANIEAVADDPLRSAHLTALRAALGRVDGALAGPARTPRTLESAAEAIDALWKAAFELSDATGEQVETGLSGLQVSTAETQQYLFWQSAAVILLTAALVTVFTF